FVPPNYIYFYELRFLRNTTEATKLNMTAIFDVSSVIPDPNPFVNGPFPTSTYGLITDDQTNVAKCRENFTYLPADPSSPYVQCLAQLLDDSNTRIDTTRTVLSIAAGLQEGDVLLIHIDSYLVPACVSTNSTGFDKCVPNNFVTVSNTTT